MLTKKHFVLSWKTKTKSKLKDVVLICELLQNPSESSNTNEKRP